MPSRRSAAPPPPRRPELFFALVRPTGCPGEEVIAALDAELARVRYRLQPVVKFSSLLHTLKAYAHLRTLEGPEDERIEAHMNAGDDLRKRFEDEGVLALLAIEAIRDQRPSDSSSIAWVLDSLKHKAEVKKLRQVYGEQLIVLSLYADQDERKKVLARKITHTRGTSKSAESRAHVLIKRDQEGSDTISYGQDVRGTFPLADYFLSMSQDIRKQVGRMIETLFGRPTRSPFPDEYAMAVAHMTALRSADLSRQVGATICDSHGEVLAAGCNEVPKPGGGVYWEGDPNDKRDFTLGHDPNTTTSTEMLIELFERMKEQRWLSARATRGGLPKLASQARLVLGKLRINSLIEFGRIVHAEMNAVLQAAARGVALRETRMVCTTFPCHLCARHLLGAGLSEVVYIEPYPKSLATEQYPGAIAVGEKAIPGQLLFRPFMGWSPSLYFRLFKFASRKDATGYVERWDPKDAKPKAVNVPPDAHRTVEDQTINRTKRLLVAARITRSASKTRPLSKRTAR